MSVPGPLLMPSLPMLRYFTCCSLLLVWLLATASKLAAQDTDQKAQLAQGLKELQAALAELPAQTPQLADAAIYAKAMDWVLRHDEFAKPDDAGKFQRVLTLGRQRVQALRSGQPTWGRQSGKWIQAYRSRVDGSLQPYVVTLPSGYDPSSRQQLPLVVVLHGRSTGMTEASFILQSEGKPPAEDQTWIELAVFGRTNNAYRWAGETDVFEAIEDVRSRYPIDERRISLWGFSMGGAGAWHLGLHYPRKWASVGAGAGFVDYYTYQKRTEKLPDYQDRALSIYDAIDYAANIDLVPFITYGGELDPQLLASQAMQTAAEKEGTTVPVLVGPGMGHKFHPDSQREFMSFLQTHNRQGIRPLITHPTFRFVTYTPKYNSCDWLTLEELTTPYKKAGVSADLSGRRELRLKTENVAALSLDRGLFDTVILDASRPITLTGDATSGSSKVYFIRETAGWRLLTGDDAEAFAGNASLHKRHNLQGPIDDAFMEPFLCVQGTSSPWSSELDRYAAFSLQRFRSEYDKWLRAVPPLKKDADVTPEDIQEKNLILFGDPGSNSLLEQVVSRLPLKWTRQGIEFGGVTYSTRDHAVVLIFPNPLNPRRYVVINSGMTMHDADFRGTNALLFPKLGDHAVIQFRTAGNQNYEEAVVSAGIFDSRWQVEVR